MNGNNQNVLLITGSTGFIGKRLVEELSPKVKKIYLFVRKASFVKAESLFKHLNNVSIIEADFFLLPSLGLSQEQFQNLFEEVTDFIHAASLYDLKSTQKEAMIHSTILTQNILYFANKLHHLKTFHYLSTYAVNIRLKGLIGEEILDPHPNPSDPYSWSKNKSEHLVREHLNPKIQCRIYRPGIVISDSKTGKVEKWDGPYLVLESLIKLKTLFKKLHINPYISIPFPFHEEASLPLIPVDECVSRLTTLILNPVPHYQCRTYHLVPENPVLFSQLLKWFSKKLKLNINWIRIHQNIIPSPLIRLICNSIFLPKSMYLYSQTKFELSTKNVSEDFCDLKYFQKLSFSKTAWILNAEKYLKERTKS